MEGRPDGTPVANRSPTAAAAAKATPDDSEPSFPLKLPPAAFYHHTTDSGTYVVQVAKDQICRVPPPENAAIAERYRNTPSLQNGKNSFWRSPFCIALFCLIGLVLTIAAAAGIVYLIVSPRKPLFSVVGVHAKNATRRPHRSPTVVLDISLKAENPNRRMGILYAGDADTVLLSKKREIGKGKFAGFYQESRESKEVKVAVVAANAALPPEIERSITEKNKAAVAAEMEITVGVPVRMQLGAAKTWEMDLRVECKFKVSALGNGGRVTDQQCETNVKT